MTAFEKIKESEYGGSLNNAHVTRRGEVMEVTLTYPNIAPAGAVKYVEVDQESVRASDSVRLHYDYERDGWVVQQASRFAWNCDDKVMDPDWQEVAFVEAWSRAESEEEQDRRLAGVVE